MTIEERFSKFLFAFFTNVQKVLIYFVYFIKLKRSMHVFTIFSDSLTSQSYMQNLKKIFDKAYLTLNVKKTEKCLSRTVYHT